MCAGIFNSLKGNFAISHAVFVLFVLHFFGLFSQSHNSTFSLNSADSLTFLTVTNKKVPKELEQPVYKALIRFPELHHTHIRFKFQRISTTMNARPTLGSMIFRKKKNYRFVVRINNTKRDSVIQYTDIPDSAKIGVFGHEFCHFIDYLDARPFHILERGAAYLSKRRKAKFEREIDNETIKRGLGRELYAWSIFLHYHSNATASYKKFKEYTYMKPEEIRSAIERFERR
jgi:hypothetical protein